MIDIHNHVLPGIDDGSSSIEESLEIIRLYKENGYTGVIATPHHYQGKYLPSKEDIILSKEKLQTALDENNIEFDIHLGNEIYLDENVIKKLEKKEIFTLAGSRYVLLEFPFLGKIHSAPNLIYQIQLLGLMPIIAHVERYELTKLDMPFVEELVRSGAYLQINLSSLRNHGTDAYNNAIKLLERNMVHFVATDTHSPTGRNPEVSKELKFLKDKMGEVWYKKVVIDNPKKVVENKIVFKDEIKKEEVKVEKKGFFARLFGKK